MTDNKRELAGHLRNYEQADEDGVMVRVSRQACDEAAAALRAAEQQEKRVRGVVEAHIADLRCMAAVFREASEAFNPTADECEKAAQELADALTPQAEPAVDLPELAGELERQHAIKVCDEVEAIAGDRAETDPFWAGHSQACEEMRHRLQHPEPATPPAPVGEREEAARLVAEHAAKMQRAPGLEPLAHALDLAARALRKPLLAGVPVTDAMVDAALSARVLDQSRNGVDDPNALISSEYLSWWLRRLSAEMQRRFMRAALEAARHAKPGQVIPISNEVMAQLTQPTHPMFAPVDEPTASMAGLTKRAEPEGVVEIGYVDKGVLVRCKMTGSEYTGPLFALAEKPAAPELVWEPNGDWWVTANDQYAAGPLFGEWRALWWPGEGHEEVLGTFPTPDAAKQACEQHAKENGQ